MAWKLQKGNGAVVFHLMVNVEIHVGRKEAQFLICDDPSISRRHATLNVSHGEGNLKNPEKYPTVTVKDQSSKYGTFVNNMQLKPDTVHNLKQNDCITFGVCSSSYKLIYEPLVVTTSCVENTDKIILKNAIRTLGGHLVPEWRQDCTHLVMTEVKVTIKAVCALIALKPLVTLTYFAELVSKCNTAETLSTKNYIPTLGEEALDQDNVTFDIVPERKTIFKGKIFVFLSIGQYKKLNVAITLSGAASTLVDKHNADRLLETILKSNVCVIHPNFTMLVDDDTKVMINRIENTLKSRKKRLIPESDIGLAVVHCSTDHYCNPDYHTADDSGISGKIPSQTLSQHAIYAMETQTPTPSQTSQSQSLTSCKVMKISESVEVAPNTTSTPKETIRKDATVSSNSKRPRNASNETEQPTTKIAKKDTVVSPPLPPAESVPVLPSVTEPVLTVKLEPESTSVFDDTDTQPLSPNVFKTESEGEVDFDMDTEPIKCQEPEPRLNLTNGSVSEAEKSRNKPSQQNVLLPGWTDTSILTPTTNVPRPVLQQNGDDDSLDTTLYSVVRVVKFVSLVKRPPGQAKPKNINVTIDGTVNFKKFRKSLNAGANRLPRIIGGNDLKPYSATAEMNAETEEWLAENHSSDEDGGAATATAAAAEDDDWI